MLRTTTLAAAAFGLALAHGAAAQTLPETRVTVIGNFGITTQSRTLEAPFWNQRIPQASNQRITVNFRPWNEAGLRGPEVFRILGRGQANIATAQLGAHAGDAAINDGNDFAGLTSSIDEFRRVTEAFRPMLARYYEERSVDELATRYGRTTEAVYRLLSRIRAVLNDCINRQLAAARTP